MSVLDQMNKRSNERHAAQVAAGEHDTECEWRGNGHYLCHCSKRKREAKGYTMPPDDLIFNYPTCPRCYEEVEGDGDSFYCSPCKASWHSDGTGAEFTDDYGDLDPTPWDERAAEAEALTDAQK